MHREILGKVTDIDIRGYFSKQNMEGNQLKRFTKKEIKKDKIDAYCKRLEKFIQELTDQPELIDYGYYDPENLSEA